MIMDERTEFADAVSVAAAAGTALIGDVLDLEALGGSAAGLGNPGDIGNGQPVYLILTVGTEIITAGVAGTLEFVLASDAQAAIATDGSATEHLTIGPFVTDDAGANDAVLNAGAVLYCGSLPAQGPVYERYLGILAVTGTTATTAGTINAFLTLDPIGWKAYPEGAN